MEYPVIIDYEKALSDRSDRGHVIGPFGSPNAPCKNPERKVVFSAAGGDFYLNDEIENWLTSRKIEAGLHWEDGTWIVTLHDKTEAMLFKLTWT